MKTKSRNFLITSLMMIVMMLAILFGVVSISPLTAYADTLPALSNVQLVGNTLSWDAFTGATEYYVMLGSGSQYYTTNSADLSAFAADYHFETGTYDWYVYAVDEDGNQISLKSTSYEYYSTNPDYDYNDSYAQYSYTNTQARLSTPTGLVWDHTTLKWNGVSGAKFYFLEVYEVGNVFVTRANIYSGTSFSCNSTLIFVYT